MTKIEFTTARGAKVEISCSGVLIEGRINGGKLMNFEIDDHAALGLVLTTVIVDHARKTMQTVTVPVPASAVDAIAAIRPVSAAYVPPSDTELFMDRLNRRMNSARSDL